MGAASLAGHATAHSQAVAFIVEVHVAHPVPQLVAEDAQPTPAGDTWCATYAPVRHVACRPLGHALRLRGACTIERAGTPAALPLDAGFVEVRVAAADPPLMRLRDYRRHCIARLYIAASHVVSTGVYVERCMSCVASCAFSRRHIALRVARQRSAARRGAAHRRNERAARGTLAARLARARVRH